MSKLSVFQRARSRMLIFHPFFATMLLSTPSLISRNIETACTDMVRIWYNPEFIESLSVEIAMFVMAHEIFHIILKHGLRVGSRDRELANIAMDYAINYQLKKYGFTIWPKCCYHVRFKDMPWEQIYEILKKEEEKNPGRHKGGQGKPSDEGDEFDGEGNPLPRKGQGVPRTGEHKDGIGNDMSPPRAVTQDEIRKIEARIERQVVAAFQSAQMAGNVPAGMELLVDGIIKPPLPWYDVLLAFMLQMARELEDWSRPNRRQPMMPSYRNPGMGKLGFIGDSSGSMLTDHIYAQMGMEMTTAATMTHPEQVICVWADHDECSFEQVFEPGDEIILKPRGGGGTDMRLPLKYMEQHEVACCILVTDAETPWPDEETPFPLIVLTTRETNAIKDIPKWAHVIPIR